MSLGNTAERSGNTIEFHSPAEAGVVEVHEPGRHSIQDPIPMAGHEQRKPDDYTVAHAVLLDKPQLTEPIERIDTNLRVDRVVEALRFVRKRAI